MTVYLERGSFLTPVSRGVFYTDLDMIAAMFRLKVNTHKQKISWYWTWKPTEPLFSTCIMLNSHKVIREEFDQRRSSPWNAIDSDESFAILFNTQHHLQTSTHTLQIFIALDESIVEAILVDQVLPVVSTVLSTRLSNTTDPTKAFARHSNTPV